jgi:putative ABC transport system permease protein
LRRLLVVTQIVLASVLLSGAALMFKSFWLMYAYPPGFHPERIVLMKTTVNGPQYFGNVQRQRAHIEEVLRQVRATEGVVAASVVFRGPAQTTFEGSPPLPPGQEPPLMTGTAASAEYAKVMGLRLVRGSWFTGAERERVAVINESLARRDLPGQDPIGKRLLSVGTVIGVVADLKFSKLDAKPEPEFFTPYLPGGSTGARGIDNATIMVQTAGIGSRAAARLHQLVSEVDKTQTVYDLKTLDQALAESIAPRRLNLFLLATFAVAALSIALIGIYGVTAYSVAQRTNEIGIRMALGAQRTEVVRMVLRQGLKWAMLSIFLGITAALALTRLMAGLLYDVQPADPPTFVAVGIALVMTAAAACWLPALKAASVDPMTALRHE